MRGVVLPLALGVLLTARAALAEDAPAASAPPPFELPSRTACETSTIHEGLPNARLVTVCPYDLPPDFKGSRADAAVLHAEDIDRRIRDKNQLLVAGAVIGLGGAALIVGGSVAFVRNGHSRAFYAGLYQDTNIFEIALGGALVASGGFLTIYGATLSPVPPRRSGANLSIGPGSARLSVAF